MYDILMVQLRLAVVHLDMITGSYVTSFHKVFPFGG